ncbi:hypothetical protein A3768_0135 [Ralstonia solanacearum]|nr:hypothetical protein A3768_0135 [Ralstonia solanacearum]
MTTRIVRMPLLNAAADGRGTCFCKRVFRRAAAYGRRGRLEKGWC